MYILALITIWIRFIYLTNLNRFISNRLDLENQNTIFLGSIVVPLYSTHVTGKPKTGAFFGISAKSLSWINKFPRENKTQRQKKNFQKIVHICPKGPYRASFRCPLFCSVLVSSRLVILASQFTFLSLFLRGLLRQKKQLRRTPSSPNRPSNGSLESDRPSPSRSSTFSVK